MPAGVLTCAGHPPDAQLKIATLQVRVLRAEAFGSATHL